MDIAQKIKTIYPGLTEDDFYNYIVLQNDLDGVGDYIAKWAVPGVTQPTQQQLESII